MKNKNLKLILIITSLLIFIDQISKLIIQYIYQNPIGEGVIGITLIQNTGIAFGVNNGNLKNIILTVFILGIVVNFVRKQVNKMDNKSAIAISMILGGGISNLLDRIIRGGVIDFIRVRGFAIFNIADCFIVLGWILMVILVFKINKEIVGGKVARSSKNIRS